MKDNANIGLSSSEIRGICIMVKDTALIVIDVQVAMFSSIDGNSVYESGRILQNILLLIQKARVTDTPVIFIQHTDDRDPEYAEGTSLWKLHPMLNPLEREKIIQKSTWDSFHMTTLNEELQKLGVKKLIIAGMQSEFCVDTTCRRAFSMGYEGVLVEDAHTTFDTKALSAKKIIEHHNRVLGGRFVKLMSVKDITF